MAQRIFFIVVVCILLFNSVCYAQQKSVEFFPYFSFKPLLPQYNTQLKKQYNQGRDFDLKAGMLPSLSLKENTSGFFSVSPDYYAKNMGFFCRQELKFEKTTSIPLRFRLGSVAYTDYLEQKPNAARH